MALEPLLPDLDDDNPELRDFSRRFWWTLPLTLVVLALAMAGERLHLMDMATQSWVELVLSLPIVLWAGCVERAGSFGQTADYVRASGGRPLQTRWVAGVRFWF